DAGDSRVHHCVRKRCAEGHLAEDRRRYAGEVLRRNPAEYCRRLPGHFDVLLAHGEKDRARRNRGTATAWLTAQDCQRSPRFSFSSLSVCVAPARTISSAKGTSRRARRKAARRRAACSIP